MGPNRSQSLGPTWHLYHCMQFDPNRTASVSEWLRAWDTLATMKLWGRGVMSLIPDRGIIVGRVFSPTSQLIRFSHLICPPFKILNLFGILSPWGSSNHRPSAPFLYEVASHVKNCHFGDYYYFYYFYYFYYYYYYYYYYYIYIGRVVWQAIVVRQAGQAVSAGRPGGPDGPTTIYTWY